MADRTPLEQAKFDAAELVNRASEALPAEESVTLDIQNIKVETKATVEGE